MSAQLITVEFKRHPDGNTNQLAKQLEKLGINRAIIDKVRRGRPVLLELKSGDPAIQKLHSLGFYRKVAA